MHICVGVLAFKNRILVGSPRYRRIYLWSCSFFFLSLSLWIMIPRATCRDRNVHCTPIENKNRVKKTTQVLLQRPRIYSEMMKISSAQHPHTANSVCHVFCKLVRSAKKEWLQEGAFSFIYIYVRVG